MRRCSTAEPRPAEAEQSHSGFSSITEGSKLPTPGADSPEAARRGAHQRRWCSRVRLRMTKQSCVYRRRGVSEATAEVIPKEEDLAEAAGRELRTGLSQRDVDGPADEAAATCCLSRGLVDLGITFALRAARAYHHEGDAAAVSRVLAAASTHAPAMSSRAMASLARARAGAGELTEA